MPLPKPRSGEAHDAWIERCMGDDAMNSEYGDRSQRYAVCQSQWERRGGGKSETKSDRLAEMDD